ncbi:MAG: carbohydrate binding domain-containing protein [Anaerolineae bacterium]|nr:carbohydrate binding domain-containing protein [Anaerolineae bacterium]
MTNLIINGDFATTQDWAFYSSVGGKFRIIDGHAECTVAGKGGDNIQLYQTGLTLKPLTRYRLTFNASCNGPETVLAYIQRHVPPNDGYGLRNGVAEVDADTRSFSFTFTTPDGTLDNGRLRLAMNKAGAGSVFKISDIQLYELPSEPEPDPEPEPVEPRRIVQVVTPRLEPGDVLEVYCARPERLVIDKGDIDFDATPWAFHATYRYEADQNN